MLAATRELRESRNSFVTLTGPVQMSSQERAATQQRRRRLVELLDSGHGNVHELAASLGVSLSTVRRDLAALARRGAIVRTYGGAFEFPVERSWHDKERALRAEKDVIARAAAKLVRAGDVVLLDAGTTTARLARELRDRTDITIVTNGLPALLELADAAVEVVVLGGRLRRPNEAILGTSTEQALRRVSPNIAFLGADGVDPARGINCPDYEQAALKEAMADSAQATWVVADHTKLTSDGFRYWAAMPKGTGLITDARATALDSFSSHGWVVHSESDAAGAPAAARGSTRDRASAAGR